MGLSKGTLIEKLFRDARAGTIEDGANDSLALSAAPTMISSHAY
jgi:alkylation response protein AidB-like acyl-CoA dehydrogenase